MGFICWRRWEQIPPRLGWAILPGRNYNSGRSPAKVEREMTDFVDFPLLKLMNRENAFSRIEKLERQNGAKPSARVTQLGQMSQNTGNLVVDGTIEIIDRANGGTS